MSRSLQVANEEEKILLDFCFEQHDTWPIDEITEHTGIPRRIVRRYAKEVGYKAKKKNATTHPVDYNLSGYVRECRGRCGQSYSLDFFPKNKTRYLGYGYICNGCMKERCREKK